MYEEATEVLEGEVVRPEAFEDSSPGSEACKIYFHTIERLPDPNRISTSSFLNSDTLLDMRWPINAGDGLDWRHRSRLY